MGWVCYPWGQRGGAAGLRGRVPAHLPGETVIAGIGATHSELPARASQLDRVARAAGVEVWLTLSAGAQAGVIGDAVRAFAAFGTRALLLTRLDEAVSLGGTLSALATTGLPVAYVSSGQRIPEDLAPARAHQLVARAVYLARSADTSVGEELLVRRFGGVAHALG
nr:MAG: hypothetical protein DIU62_01480 [Pseudomonadota bacterium]